MVGFRPLSMASCTASAYFCWMVLPRIPIPPLVSTDDLFDCLVAPDQRSLVHPHAAHLGAFFHLLVDAGQSDS